MVLPSNTVPQFKILALNKASYKIFLSEIKEFLFPAVSL
jgi:hypothetical protein